MSLVPLPVDRPVWPRFFGVAPLVLVGTKDRVGYDVAPKHMAMPLGWSNYYCFACSPSHATYANAERERTFTVSFPRPEQVVETSLAASGRDLHGRKLALRALPTFPATTVDGVLVEGCSAYLECEVVELLDGYGDNSLVIGRVVAAAVREESLRLHDRDDADLIHDEPLLAYLGSGRFAVVRESHAFPFPEDFST